MVVTTLRELVELWKHIHSNDIKPRVFISQKFQDCEHDKIITYSGNKMTDRYASKWVLMSKTCVPQANNDPVLYTYHYKKIGRGCVANFQLKPPVKSYFVDIPGPYKQM